MKDTDDSWLIVMISRDNGQDIWDGTEDLVFLHSVSSLNNEWIHDLYIPFLFLFYIVQYTVAAWLSYCFLNFCNKTPW